MSWSDNFLRGLADGGRKNRIKVAIEGEFTSEDELRAAVAGRNIEQATALFQQNNFLSPFDASTLAGLLFPVPHAASNTVPNADDPSTIARLANEISLYISIGTERGCATAVSPTLAITALHARVAIGSDVIVTDRHGIAREATLHFEQYAQNKVDIALLQLKHGQTPFSSSSPLCSEALQLGQRVHVVGYSLIDDVMMPTFRDISIETIDFSDGSSMVRSAYHCFEGLSGAGVILAGHGDQLAVVGVHVAVNDDTETPPPVKKVKKSRSADADSVSDTSDSLAKSIHGHTAFTLICEAYRVESLKAAMRNLLS
eukprot:CAMPEP_0181323196 /NCGR_PEP_ID=MMETSP1101-20121128/19646_1 /TAXON_ID=46948 /ORGANISM="Rhodomonas abbreviata, Strain Caron Lab Isolate" /LENGTH=313 /DNA_ID=CAMNT_0023431187 /DNA_START=140 /DNA_END=1081 /DNA_ORIENTATION=-